MQSLHLNHSRGQQWLGLDLYFLQLSSPTFAVSYHYSEEEKNSKEHRRYKCYKYNNIVCISLKTENLILPVSQKKIILSKFRLPKEYMLS